HQLLSSGVSAQSFSPDGRVLALGVGDNTIGLYDPATGKLQRQMTGRPVRVGGFSLTPLPSVHIVAFSPDGRTLASLGASNIVRLWDAKSGKELHWLMGHKDYADSAAFSPDGKMLATGDSNGTVRLWEVATGKERRRFVGHEDRVAALAFSPDGKLLASASLDTTALLWDVTGTAQNEGGK
ncbi:MAG TPA: WD40 repeat domain-containing protein, partial [Gemmataceae bacterium]|nr:WD40 repeat domain-containing protein [Gemmataceae bacterium]